MEEYMNTLSQLPNDILVTILLKSSLLDRVRAGAVCVSWQSALKEIKTLKLQPPYLLLLSNDLETDSHRVLDLSNNTIYGGVHIPETHEVFYLGSFHGWLILSKCFTTNIFLFNPSSKQQIKLPDRAKIWNLITNRHYDVDDFGQCVDLPYTAILTSAPTSDDCAVLIVDSQSRLSFCRLGDATWTVFKGVPFYDIAWYEGRLYFIRRKDAILINFPNFIGWNSLPPKEVEIEKHYKADKAYLVKSCGDLLMVLMSVHETFEALTREFFIFKMDPSGRFSVKVESLGDRIIFLGKGSSKSFSATGLSGFQENSIYFKDGKDFSVFHLEDGSIKPCFPTWYFSYEPLIWLML